MKTSSTFGLVGSLLFVTPALAAGPAEQAKERVQIADLDLSRASDRAKLDGRIRQAVNTACGDASTVDLAGANAIRRCSVEARGLAQAQVERATASARQPAPTTIALGR
ncbi:MAG TPA: UrcA family protein [Allosphingosinicella sp.]|jgi:UrcA family protein|uniref:UrcA family protein n=1 Tax=Allosphingosinicella sp. TaxID=2823234 RepID=UPI002F2964C5